MSLAFRPSSLAPPGLVVDDVLSEPNPPLAGQQASRFVANRVYKNLLGSSARSILGLGRKPHRKTEQGEAGRQCQGPRAKCGLACRTEAAPDGEADNRR